MDSISNKASDTDAEPQPTVQLFPNNSEDVADALLHLSKRIRAGFVLCSAVTTKVVNPKLSRVEISFFIHPEPNDPTPEQSEIQDVREVRGEAPT